MGATTGITAIVNYATAGTDAQKVQALLDLIPDSDSLSSSGSQAAPNLNQGNSNSFLDEMSPAAATQLRVELAALKAAVS